jgi:hypothetical protein
MGVLLRVLGVLNVVPVGRGVFVPVAVAVNLGLW